MNTTRSTITGLAVALVLLAAGWSHAQQAYIQLQSMAEMEKEVLDEEGSKRLQRVPVTTVVPGDEVIFTTLYENVSGRTVENAVITNPMPEHMVYVDGSAEGEGARITFSVDGGATYDSPARLTMVDSAGREYPARPQDYTHIRWTFEDPLPSGAKGAVSFRAILK